MNTDAITIRARQVQAIQARLAGWAMGVPMPPNHAPDRHHIGYQEFGLSFHHSASIASHLERHGPDLAASAFALVRPMYETLQRGWWFTLCATDAQAAIFVNNDQFRGGSLVQVATAIEEHPPFAGTGFFSGFAQKEWGLYHSFTHGGRAALEVYGHRPNLDPNFDPATIIAVLDNVSRMSAVATMGMCWVSRIYDAARADPIYQEVLALAPYLEN